MITTDMNTSTPGTRYHLPHTPPRIIAHRGYSSRYPENTLVSFQAAMDKGALMLELDVTLTKDRQPVVIHDETLDRTTNASGRVCDHTLLELKQLDAGSWFSEKFKGECIPTLEEVFELTAGKIMMNIEIKPEAYEDTPGEDSIENQVLHLVGKYQCAPSVMVSTFEKKLIQRIAKMKGKTTKTAFLSEDSADMATMEFLKNHNVYSWNPDWRILSKGQVDMMRKENIQVFAYTINDRKVAKRLFAMGVSGIFTDDPGLFL